MSNSALEDISSVIGFTATLRLSLKYGGRNLHVPMKVDAGHSLCELLGEPAFRRLVQEWPSESLWIPNIAFDGCPGRSHVPDSVLIDSFRKGMSSADVAKVTGLRIRAVNTRRRKLECTGLIPLRGFKLKQTIA